jgi:hypothetical protein
MVHNKFSIQVSCDCAFKDTLIRIDIALIVTAVILPPPTTLLKPHGKGEE